MDKKEKENMKRQTKIRGKLQADVGKRTASLEKKEREIGAKHDDPTFVFLTRVLEILMDTIGLVFYHPIYR